MSQAQLGTAVYTSGDLLAKVEKAERRPRPDLIDRLDAALDACGELIRIGTGLPPVTSRLSFDAGSTAHRPGQQLPTDMSQAPDVLKGIRDVLAGCRRLDHVLGPEVVASTVATQMSVAVAILPASRGVERREVLRTLAQLHQLSGWLAFDRQDMRSATGKFESAARYAEVADDAALLAFVLGPSHGFAATYSGDPAGGVARGHAALELAHRAGNPRLTAFVQATTARGYAKLGDTRSTLELLDDAQRAMDDTDPDEPVADWLTVFDAAALQGHRGSCLLDLAEPEQAADALGAQDAAAPRCFARNRAIWLLDRTRAYLDLGDLETACQILEQALSLTGTTSSRRITTQVAEYETILSPHRSNAVVAATLDLIRAGRSA